MHQCYEQLRHVCFAWLRGRHVPPCVNLPGGRCEVMTICRAKSWDTLYMRTRHSSFIRRDNAKTHNPLDTEALPFHSAFSSSCVPFILESCSMSTLCGDEIQAWIDDQPGSHGVAHIQKKRKLAHPQTLASKRPRRHLGIVDHNAVSQARSRSMAPARTTKLSSTVDQSSGSGSRPGRQKHSTQLKDDEVDPQQPSRARRSLRGGQRSEASVPAGQTIGMDTTQSSQSYAKLPASQQFDALRTLDTVASVSSAGDLYAAMLARNAASKKSARPQSPSKKSSASSSGQAMRLGKDKVDFRTLDKDNLPADAAMLFRKILHYSQGQRILPTSVDVCLTDCSKFDRPR